MKTRNQLDDDDHNQKDAMLLTQVKYRSFAKLVLMVLNLCMSPFYFGYTIQYLGTFDFKQTIMEIFGITMFSQGLAKGLYNGCVPVGAGVGALTSFLLLKNFSRKNSLLVVNAIALVFGALIFIKNPWTFLLARTMQGVCVGFYSAIAPLIIKQLAPNQISGTLGAFNQLFVAFGVFFACLLQLILKQINDKQQDYWFIMFGFTLITVTLQTLLLLIVYKFETPKYLLENNRQQQCKEVLKWIYLDQYVEEILNEKKNDLGMEVTTVNKQSVVSNENRESKKQSKLNKLRLIVSIQLAMLQQLVGINAVVIYGTQIAKSVLPDLGNLIPVILNLEQTLACLLTSYLLTRLGRKIILQAGTGVATLSLIMIGIGFFLKDPQGTGFLYKLLIIGGLVVFMANFGLSLGPIVWLYIPQILEPSYISFSTGANWATASLITFLFPVIKQAVGEAPLFLFYAGYSIFGFFFDQKYVVETKGKTQKQIYNQYETLAS